MLVHTASKPCKRAILSLNTQRRFRDISHSSTPCELHTAPKVVIQDIQHLAHARLAITLHLSANHALLTIL